MRVELKHFQSTASLPIRGLVVIFDLEGFSRFFAQPDVQEYVPKYLNHVINAMKIVIEGGVPYWVKEAKQYDSLPSPIHLKFLGDGVLLIWNYKDFGRVELERLFNRLWNLKKYFNKVNIKAAEDVPVIDIPKKIRFGVASGTVYKLNYQNSTVDEYIGYCINLASRLQNYCSELGFIGSARVTIPSDSLSKNGYKKVIATKIKGLPEEIVIVDKNEFEKLTLEIRKSLFMEIE